MTNEHAVSRFHWRDGWYFSRGPAGEVVVEFPFANRLTRDMGTQTIIIPPNEWASIVASVVPGGETTETYYAALAFHSPVATLPPGPEHRCGVRGFDQMKGDECPACEKVRENAEGEA